MILFTADGGEMFRRIMVANRGEVAARIVRTAKKMGIETVAVASTADSNAGWLGEATTVVTIGGPRAADSYLNVNALIEVARHHRCSAVHPGWGFLAENAQFAQQCQAVGLTFIGPDAHHLRIMGDKSMARSTMTDAGLAPIPGSKAVLKSIDEAKAVAKEVGYPLLLKAVAGGGGRGMRGVESEEHLGAAFMEASA